MDARDPRTTSALSADKLAGTAETTKRGPVRPAAPAPAPIDFAALMRRVEAEFYDAA